MAVTVADILDLMREVGIEKEIVDGLKPDVPLLQQGLDSVDLPVIAFATEKEYDVDIFHAEGMVLRTIDDLVAFLNEKLVGYDDSLACSAKAGRMIRGV